MQLSSYPLYPCHGIIAAICLYQLMYVYALLINFLLTALPYSKFGENENTILVTTTRGGHFGFMEGIVPFGMTWMNRAIRQSLSALKHIASL